MNSVYLQLLVISASLLGFIECKLCVHSDVTCTTKAANRVYSSLVETSDPLRKDQIIGNLRTMHFVTTNITMTGLRDCQVTNFLYSSAEYSGEFNIQCPKLYITWYYEVMGLLHNLQMDAKGTAKITADEYFITYKFDYDKVIGTDKAQHIFIRNSEINAVTKGMLTFEAENQVGDPETLKKLAKAYNDDWRSMEKLFQKPFFDPILMKLKKNFSHSLQAYPIDKIIADE